MDSFERIGYWWLPTDPDTKVPGKLVFDPATGAKLELLGDLSSQNSKSEARPARFAIIHGYASGDYQRVTLSDCYVQVTSVDPVKDFNETELHVDRIYMSKLLWFSNTDDLVFERIDVSFTHLSDWMIQDNASNELMRVSKDSAGDYSVTFFLRDLKGTPFDNAEIWIWVAANTTQTGRTETSVKFDFRCTIEPQSKLHFDSFSPLFEFYLPKFLNVATAFANFPLNLIGYSDRSDLSSGVRIYYRIPGFADSKVSIFGGQLLFTFSDVRARLAKCMAQWISNGRKLWTVYELYSMSYYRKGSEKTAEFMDLAHALEAYHRTLDDGEYMSEEDYEPIKKRIIAAIPRNICKDHSKALKGGLKYGYQFSLRTRLKKLLNEVLAEQSENITAFVGNQSTFIHRLVETRNHYTHFDGEPNKHVLRDDEFYDFALKLRLLLQICFLKEMGLPSNEISRILNNNWSYKRFARASKT